MARSDESQHSNEPNEIIIHEEHTFPNQFRSLLLDDINYGTFNCWSRPRDGRQIYLSLSKLGMTFAHVPKEQISC